MSYIHKREGYVVVIFLAERIYQNGREVRNHYVLIYLCVDGEVS